MKKIALKMFTLAALCGMYAFTASADTQSTTCIICTNQYTHVVVYCVYPTAWVSQGICTIDGNQIPAGCTKTPPKGTTCGNGVIG